MDRSQGRRHHFRRLLRPELRPQLGRLYRGAGQLRGPGAELRVRRHGGQHRLLRPRKGADSQQRRRRSRMGRQPAGAGRRRPHLDRVRPFRAVAARLQPAGRAGGHGQQPRGTGRVPALSRQRPYLGRAVPCRAHSGAAGKWPAHHARSGRGGAARHRVAGVAGPETVPVAGRAAERPEHPGAETAPGLGRQRDPDKRAGQHFRGVADAT